MVLIMVPFRQCYLIPGCYIAEYMFQILGYDIGDDFSSVFDDEDEMVAQTEHRMVVSIKLCHYVALLSAHLMISITQNMELINDFLVF